MRIAGTVRDPLSERYLEFEATDEHPDAFIRDRVYIRVIDRYGVEDYNAVVLSVSRDLTMRSDDQESISKAVLQHLLTWLPGWTARVRHEPATVIPVIVIP